MMSDVHSAYEPPLEPSAETPKSHFTLVELLVVIAIIGILVAVLLPLRRGAPHAARRMQCSNNLKQIALAMHNYHDVYGELPPAYTVDEQGNRMHSWRVLILPFLEGEPLYEQYDFDEPWDGPNNRLLSEQIPSVYRCLSYLHDPEHSHDGTEGDKWLTQYVALVGDETVFAPGQTIRFADITDGTSNTLMVVEVQAECVHWMSPHDVSPKKFIQLLNSEHEKRKNHPGGAIVAMADAAVRFVGEQTKPELIRKLCTRAGGEEITEEY
jgi:prepilin-type N-terminal cleavage/methylation domain-containing protein